MPTFITDMDVITALNMKQVDANTYMVYGEKISAAAISSHTSYANDYISIYTGDITPADAKWPAAKLAALNMAMIRVVVVALGGTIYDNVNYQVGEIQVNVGPQLEQTILANLQLWREHFDMAFNALLSGMKLAKIPFGSILRSYLEQGYTVYDTGYEP